MIEVDIHSDRVEINGKRVDPEEAVAAYPWLEKYLSHLLKK